MSNNFDLAERLRPKRGRDPRSESFATRLTKSELAVLSRATEERIQAGFANLARFAINVGLSMQVHEFGHAVVNWLGGRLAVPLPMVTFAFSGVVLASFDIADLLVNRRILPT